MAISSKVLISVKHLVKEYNHGTVHALDGCDLDIHKGEVVAIIGPSGSGKSTLLRSLNMLEEPTSGAIFFDGVDLASKSVNIDLHRQKMGMVFQHFNLFPHKTVLQNITLAPITLKKKTPAEAETQARTLLERIGLSDKATSIPICSPAVRSSVSPSFGRWPWIRRSCSSTSQPPPWTPRWWVKCWT